MSLKFLLIIYVSLGIAHTSMAAAAGRGSPRTGAGLSSRSDSSHSLDSLDSDDSPRARHLPALQRRYNNKLAEMEELLRQVKTNTQLLQDAIARGDARQKQLVEREIPRLRRELAQLEQALKTLAEQIVRLGGRPGDGSISRSFSSTSISSEGSH